MSPRVHKISIGGPRNQIATCSCLWWHADADLEDAVRKHTDETGHQREDDHAE